MSAFFFDTLASTLRKDGFAPREIEVAISAAKAAAANGATIGQVVEIAYEAGDEACINAGIEEMAR